ncbi:uncharacterized protein LOC132202791 isoform X1 [Neocloeon triangulifer]|uniref:uncharacterized protein LOC132202791 isoform X1 n=1 Tax=Neocloeon triangulifer TaxID=2078957 RepID=UPI00286F77D0|nr:uncharacterized protein LOC132202791 isoform X1 [Neocloeon triangulifer]
MPKYSSKERSAIYRARKKAIDSVLERRNNFSVMEQVKNPNNVLLPHPNSPSLSSTTISFQQIQHNFNNHDVLDYHIENFEDGNTSMGATTKGHVVTSIPIQSTEEDLLERLNLWYLTNNKHCLSSYDELLKVLKNSHPELPVCAKTALKSLKCSTLTGMKNFRGKMGGFYFYTGFVNKLTALCLHNKDLRKEIASQKFIKIIIGIDGVPLFEHSKEKVGAWVICAKILSKNFYIPPITIGAFVGTSKPERSFLQDVVEEFSVICQQNFCFEMVHDDDKKSPCSKTQVKLIGICADAPARSMIKETVSSNATEGCERCCSKSRCCNHRMCYVPDLASDKMRTDQAFRKLQYSDHHKLKEKDPPPIFKLPQFDLVNSFFLDVMHLADEGVAKRLLSNYFCGPKKLKIRTNDLKQIDLDMESWRRELKSDDFQRPLTNIEFFTEWKASSFRDFSLYFGIVFLKPYLNPSQYLHFLKFSCAMRTLRNKKQCLVEKCVSDADNMLREFVSDWDKIIGHPDTVFCVHNLIHISNDVRRTNLPLDELSAYAFENEYGKLKSLVKSSNQPAAQLQKRLYEKEQVYQIYKIFEQTPVLSSGKGGVLKSLRYKGYEIFPASKGDSFVMLRSSHKVYKVLKIVNNGEILLESVEYPRVGEFFLQPMNSAKLGIFKLVEPDKLRPQKPKNLKLQEISCKIYLVRYKKYYISFPALHSL